MSEFTKYFVAALAFMLIVSAVVHQQGIAYGINCDSANLGANDEGHIRGNSHCSTGVEPKEPPRDCDSPNAEKDNDNDGATICIGRG